MVASKFSISLPAEIVTEIEARETRDGERSTIIARSLDRYFWLLQQARRALAETLNDAEIGLILDALNGTAWMEPLTFQVAWAEIADAVRLDKLDEKWSVDGRTLVRKLKALSPVEAAALVDASERWWGRVGAGEQPDHAEALR